MSPAIRVHSLAQARAALDAARALGRPVTLVSPPGALAGVGWWREIVRALGDEADAVFDCGPSPGLALAAIRGGIRRLWLDADAATLAKVASIAEQAGSRADGAGGIALDLLGEPNPGEAVGEALGSAGT